MTTGQQNIIYKSRPTNQMLLSKIISFPFASQSRTSNLFPLNSSLLLLLLPCYWLRGIRWILSFLYIMTSPDVISNWIKIPTDPNDRWPMYLIQLFIWMLNVKPNGKYIHPPRWPAKKTKYGSKTNIKTDYLYASATVFFSGADRDWGTQYETFRILFHNFILLHTIQIIV